MRTISALSAAGYTHPGHYREVNEDRFHIDVQRGLFLVVDGVGGQAAGGKAADTAIQIMRARLERETGPVAGRVREAIAAANNEIHRLASLRGEWAGMACVVTAAVFHDDVVTVGHVGDTRLYRIRRDRIEKVTRDHSPVGEREDAGELTELEAMRNPRRNEVYRDVGSEPHDPDDPDFIDIIEIPFEADAALLLCSDGLSDLVASASIHRITMDLAGHPDEVARALVTAANKAGGKDNVTVVYVEGDRFASDRTEPLARAFRESPADAANRVSAPQEPPAGTSSRTMRVVLLLLLFAVLGASTTRIDGDWPNFDLAARIAGAAGSGPLIVRRTDSIRAALERATPGRDVIVDPGEYRERIQLKNGVRLISRNPGRATIRLPSDASDDDPAVVADGVSGAELTGFRIIGDAATPLGTGLFIRNASIRLVDVEISGSARSAIDVGGLSAATIIGSDIHHNQGAALRVDSGARVHVRHSAFIRNGSSADAGTALLLEARAQAHFSRNVFQGFTPAAFVTLDEATRTALVRDNWFVEPAAPRDGASRGGRAR